MRKVEDEYLFSKVIPNVNLIAWNSTDTVENVYDNEISNFILFRNYETVNFKDVL